MVDDHADTDTKMTRRTPTVNFKVLSLTFEEQSVEINYMSVLHNISNSKNSKRLKRGVTLG